MLLVSSPSYRTGGKAWLYDLNTSENEPLEIANSNFYLGQTIAISEQFAVIGDPGYWVHWGSDYFKYPRLPPRTLIKSLDNGSTTIIESLGELSIDKNILTIMSPLSDDEEHPALLEVFSLDDNATPHLILKRESFNYAWVQNGFLITLTRNEDSNSIVPNICIEPIS